MAPTIGASISSGMRSAKAKTVVMMKLEAFKPLATLTTGKKGKFFYDDINEKVVLPMGVVSFSNNFW